MVAAGALADAVNPCGIKLTAKPRSCTALKPFKKGKLLLPVVTNKVEHVPQGKPWPSLSIQLPGTRWAFLPPTHEEGFAVPAFFVGFTSDADAANMEIAVQTVSVACSLGKGKAKDKGKDPSSSDVEVPFVTNTRDVAADEELLLLKEEEEKPSKIKRSIALAPLDKGAKKTKT
jgi:hypothetical protein